VRTSTVESLSRYESDRWRIRLSKQRARWGLPARVLTDAREFNLADRASLVKFDGTEREDRDSRTIAVS